MDLSKIKMVVTDLDGTLLNSNHQVSNRFLKLFKKLKKRNIVFVAASGRQYDSIAKKLDTIRDDIYIVSENGAYVKHQNKEILTTLLPKKKVAIILNIIKQHEGMRAVLCCKHKAYANYMSKDFRTTLKQYYSNFDFFDSALTIPNDILKVAIYHAESSEKYIYPVLKHMENELKVKISGPNWVDVSSINAHKGYAVQKLVTNLNIQPHELLVFGDYNNDLEMLALAEYSFAMENAHPKVLKLSNYTTTSNDDFGVERILEKLLML